MGPHAGPGQSKQGLTVGHSLFGYGDGMANLFAFISFCCVPPLGRDSSPAWLSLSQGSFSILSSDAADGNTVL